MSKQLAKKHCSWSHLVFCKSSIPNNKKQPLYYQRIQLAENHGHRSFVLFKYYITANTLDLSKCHIFLLLMLKPSFDVCYCQRGLETVMSAFNIQY